MLRIVSFRIEPVARARQRRLVSLAQPRGERREALAPLVAAGGPAALEDDDHAWRARDGNEPEARGERRRQLGGHQHGGERGERIEMILPALALDDVVREAVGGPERRDDVARAHAAAPRHARERDEDTEPERDPRVPAVHAPRRRAAEPRVERDQVAAHDLVPGGEAADGGEPAEDGERGRRGRGDEERGDTGGRRDAARACGGDGDDGGERAGEERDVRLHRDPGAEGGPRPDQAREPPALEPARDAEGTQEEEEAEKKIALAGLPGAAGQRVRREDER